MVEVGKLLRLGCLSCVIFLSVSVGTNWVSLCPLTLGKQMSKPTIVSMILVRPEKAMQWHAWTCGGVAHSWKSCKWVCSLPIANMNHRMTERSTSDSLGDVSWVQKAAYSCTEGMCHSSTHPVMSLHVTQFYLTFTCVTCSTASDKCRVRRTGYVAICLVYTEFGLPEWIRTSKARLVFRYEISDLFIVQQGTKAALVGLSKFSLGIGYLCFALLFMLCQLASKTLLLCSGLWGDASPRRICACAVGLCAVLEWHGRCWRLRWQWNWASSSYSTVMWPSKCSTTSILHVDKLKLPTKSDLARKRNDNFNSLLHVCQHMLLRKKVPIMLKIMLA